MFPGLFIPYVTSQVKNNNDTLSTERFIFLQKTYDGWSKFVNNKMLLEAVKYTTHLVTYIFRE